MKKLEIMKLSGKCRRDFINWMCENYPEVYWHEYETMPETSLNALIIELFDLVGIYIEIMKEPNDWALNIHRGNYKRVAHSVSGFNSRTEATKSAILKANDIYNENK